MEWNWEKDMRRTGKKERLSYCSRRRRRSGAGDGRSRETVMNGFDGNAGVMGCVGDGEVRKVGGEGESGALGVMQRIRMTK